MNKINCIQIGAGNKRERGIERTRERESEGKIVRIALRGERKIDMPCRECDNDHQCKVAPHPPHV